MVTLSKTVSMVCLIIQCLTAVEVFAAAKTGGTGTAAEIKTQGTEKQKQPGADGIHSVGTVTMKTNDEAMLKVLELVSSRDELNKLSANAQKAAVNTSWPIAAATFTIGVLVIVAIFTVGFRKKMLNNIESNLNKITTDVDVVRSWISATGRAGNISVMSLEPDDGPISGGANVKIFGEGFQPQCKVLFGSQVVEHVRVISSSQLQITTPSFKDSARKVDVTVTNLNGRSDMKGQAYRYRDKLELQTQGLAVPEAGGYVQLEVNGFSQQIKIYVDGKKADYYLSKENDLIFVAPRKSTKTEVSVIVINPVSDESAETTLKYGN